MPKLKEIQDQVAKHHGLESWDHLMKHHNIAQLSSSTIEIVCEEVAKRYAQATLEEARESAVVFIPTHPALHGSKNVDKSSITAKLE